jgi:hypothetical protein
MGQRWAEAEGAGLSQLPIGNLRMRLDTDGALQTNVIDISIPKEFFDVVKVLEMGAKKHGNSNWLEPDGKKSSFKEMHDSMFHHLAESYAQGLYGIMDIDEGREYRHDCESKLDPLLHLACRALMVYTRIQRDIKHKDD